MNSIVLTDSTIEAAQICAELTRQGIRFICESLGGTWKIEITGF